MPILVKTDRLDAPLIMVQGKLFENNSQNRKWGFYDVCIISDKEITQSLKYVLSTTMTILPISEARKVDMALEFSTIKSLKIPLIDQKFLKRFVKNHNEKQHIEEVEIDFDKTNSECVVIKNFRVFKIGWNNLGGDNLTKYHKEKNTNI